MECGKSVVIGKGSLYIRGFELRRVYRYCRAPDIVY